MGMRRLAWPLKLFILLLLSEGCLSDVSQTSGAPVQVEFDVKTAKVEPGDEVTAALTPDRGKGASSVDLRTTLLHTSSSTSSGNSTGNSTTSQSAATPASDLKKMAIKYGWVWTVSGVLQVLQFVMIFKLQASPMAFNLIGLFAAMGWFYGMVLFVLYIIKLRDTFYPTGELDQTLLYPTLLRCLGSFLLMIQPWTAIVTGGKGIGLANLLGASAFHMANVMSTFVLLENPMFGPTSPSTFGMIILQIGTWCLVALNTGAFTELFPEAYPVSEKPTAPKLFRNPAVLAYVGAGGLLLGSVVFLVEAYRMP